MEILEEGADVLLAGGSPGRLCHRGGAEASTSPHQTTAVPHPPSVPSNRVLLSLHKVHTVGKNVAQFVILQLHSIAVAGNNAV